MSSPSSTLPGNLESGVGPISLQRNQNAFSDMSLQNGANVEIVWNATGKIDVFFFNSSQFSQFQSSGTTSPNVLSSSSNDSGEMKACGLPQGDYYIVIRNPNVLLNSPPITAQAEAYLVDSSSC
jgi:hypothetical protein